MMEKIKVIFVGGLTNGKIVHDYLAHNQYVDLVASFTYADECTAPRFVRIEGDELIGRSGSLKEYVETIKQSKPDLIMVAGWSELVPTELLSVAPMGVIGFHPAKLPHDRGRSVLAWQIEDGYKETALTMFKYTDYPDGGDIIAQEIVPIEENDYINDILNKMDKATYNLMKAYFPLIRKGLAVAKKQDLSEGQFRRLRGEMDSWIDWDKNSDVIYNKIRAISHPYPGALAKIGKETYKVWRAEIVKSHFIGEGCQPGCVIARYYNGSALVKTRDGYLLITEMEEL
jgi:methionyl-tRNA formyltransferase